MPRKKGTKIDYKALNKKNTFTLLEVINLWHAKTVIDAPIQKPWEKMTDKQDFLYKVFIACSVAGGQINARMGQPSGMASGSISSFQITPSDDDLRKGNRFCLAFPHGLMNAGKYSREGLFIFAESIGARPWFLFPDEQRVSGKIPKRGTKRWAERQFKKSWVPWYENKYKNNKNAKAIPTHDEMKKLLERSGLEECPVERQTMSNWGWQFSKNPSIFSEI